MEGTRLKILQLLQKNHNDTVDGLARKIGLAPATIRRHLDILQRDRFVDFQEVRKRTGRPEYSFYLTEDGQEALPKDYDRLLNLIVDELVSFTPEDTQGRDGAQILEQVFTRLSSRVSSEHEAELGGASLKVRLSTLISLLEKQDFFPEAEVVGGLLQLKLLNCPFRSVALQNKAVCSFDSSLISAMLDIDVSRSECVHDGDASCLYRAAINAKEAAELAS
jgi:predicted ArsR family transcriptional regulator